MGSRPGLKALHEPQGCKEPFPIAIIFILFTLQQKLAPLCARCRSGFLGCVRDRVKQGRCLCELLSGDPGAAHLASR